MRVFPTQIFSLSLCAQAFNVPIGNHGGFCDSRHHPTCNYIQQGQYWCLFLILQVFLRLIWVGWVIQTLLANLNLQKIIFPLQILGHLIIGLMKLFFSRAPLGLNPIRTLCWLSKIMEIRKLLKLFLDWWCASECEYLSGSPIPTPLRSLKGLKSQNSHSRNAGNTRDLDMDRNPTVRTQL